MYGYKNFFNQCLLAYSHIDDRALLRQAINLKGLNIDMTSVANSNQLMHAISEYEWLPDMLFLDINLPAKPGENILANLRAANTAKALPIVVIADFPNDEEIKYCYENGANIYLSKSKDSEGQMKIFSEILDLDFAQYPVKGDRKNFVFHADALLT